MAVYRSWTNVSGTWNNPSYAYDLTQDDTSTSTGVSLSKTFSQQTWKCTNNVSGVTSVTLKIIRTYFLATRPDEVFTGDFSEVRLEYSWNNSEYFPVSSIVNSTASDMAKAGLASESFVLDTTGKNLNQLYIRASAFGHNTKYFPDGDSNFYYVAVPVSHRVFDIYLDSATTGSTTATSVLTHGTISNSIAFSTINNKKAYTFTVPLHLEFTNNTNSGQIVVVNESKVLYQYPPSTAPGDITLSGTGSLDHTFEITTTGPINLSVSMVDSNILTVPITHSDWSNVEPPVLVNLWNTPVPIYTVDAIDNVNRTFSRQFTTISYHPLVVNAKTTGAAHPVYNPYQVYSGLAFFTGFTTTNRYWPTTGSFSTNTTNPSLAFDEQSENPVSGYEVTSYNTASSSNCIASGGSYLDPSDTVTETDTYYFTDSGVTVIDPVLKVVWDASVTHNTSGELTTFDEWNGEPVENLPQDFSSVSSIQLLYSTNAGTTWTQLSIISSSSSDSPYGQAGTWTENQLKSVSVKSIAGTYLVSDIRVKIVQTCTSRNVWSYGFDDNWYNLAELSAESAYHAYAIYLEATV